MNILKIFQFDWQKTTDGNVLETNLHSEYTQEYYLVNDKKRVNM